MLLTPAPLSVQIAAYYEKVYAAKGISIMKHAKVTSMEGANGKVRV
jgi:hypothetical protein